MQLLNALKWSFMSEFASKAIQPITFTILTRLLTPEDYGIVAAATMILSFSQIFWEAGMSKAIVQYQGDRNEAANTAFWLNFGLAFVVALVLAAVSNLIAKEIFHDQRVEFVIDVMTLQIIFSSLSSVQIALLQKDMQFQHLFWIRLTTVTIPSLFSILLAWYGMGYWALIFGAILGQLLQALIIWKVSTWKPYLKFSIKTAKDLLKFGAWIAYTGILGWFYLWADTLVIGLHMSSQELGIYHTGNSFVQIIYNLLFSPIMPVIFSHLTKKTHDLSALKRTLLSTNKCMFMVSLPVGIGLFIFGENINLIFGEKWGASGSVIAALGLMHGISWLMGANDEIYKSIGRPDIFPKIMSIGIIYYIPAYYFGSQYGLEKFLEVRFSLFIISQPLHFYFLRKTLNVCFYDTIKSVSPIIGIAVIYTLIYAIFFSHFAIAGSIFRLIISLFVYLFFSIALTYSVFTKARTDLTDAYMTQRDL